MIFQEVLPALLSECLSVLGDLEGPVLQVYQRNPCRPFRGRHIRLGYELFVHFFLELVVFGLEGCHSHFEGRLGQKGFKLFCVDRLPVLAVIQVDKIVLDAKSPVVGGGFAYDLLYGNHDKDFPGQFCVLVQSGALPKIQFVELFQQLG